MLNKPAKEPEALLLRMADVRQWLGVSEKQVSKWVESGVIIPIKINGGRNWYNKEQIKGRFNL